MAGPDREDMGLLRQLARVFNEKAFLREMKGLRYKRPLHGVELLKEGLFKPVININGLHSGYSGAGTKTILPRKASAKVDIRFGPNLEPEEVVEKIKRHLSAKGFGDLAIVVHDSYPWSRTDPHDPLVRRMIEAYRRHGCEPEVRPMATWAAPYFVFSRNLGLPVVSGGMGHGGRRHVSNEHMTVAGLLDFEKFVTTFLHLASR